MTPVNSDVAPSVYTLHVNRRA